MSNNENKTKSSNKDFKNIFTTIICGIVVAILIGLIMLSLAFLGVQIYKYNSLKTSKGGEGIFSFSIPYTVNSFYSIIGIIMYTLINCSGFLLYNYTMKQLKNNKTTVSKILFIIFSIIINIGMSFLYLAFSSYSFENGLIEFFSKIIIFKGYITFPLIFFITLIASNIYKKRTKLSADNHL